MVDAGTVVSFLEGFVGDAIDIYKGYFKSICDQIDPSLAEGKVITPEECEIQLTNLPKTANATWDYDQMHFDSTDPTHPMHFGFKSQNLIRVLLLDC